MGASVLVSASRHADPEILEASLAGLRRTAFVHQQTRDPRQHETAWPALLTSADLFVMVGLGEATLAEVTARGKPVFLAPQREVSRGFFSGLRHRVVEAIVARAQARPANDRGTTRPQEGLELYCAKLIAQGWVRPERDVETLRGRLVRSGRARLLRAPIRAEDLLGFAPPAPMEVLRVAARVRAMLGVARDDRVEDTTERD